MSLSTPTQISVPFAELGTRTAIPAAANNTTGRAGYDLGFPPINSTPKVAGGIPPFGSDMNGILYDITVAEQYIQAGGSWPYDSAFATAIGGYPLGALVQRSDGSGFWRNTLDGNTTDPDAGGANWQPEESGITSVTMTSSNVTLTSLEAARNIIVITGALTTNLNLNFPIYTKNWTVFNQTTGAFTITAKTVSGSGSEVPQGAATLIFCDGTNIVAPVPVITPGSSASQAMTSGTFKDFTGIPSWAKSIKVNFAGVSLSGSSNILIQMITSGGVVSSGYISTSARITEATTQINSSTNGFVIRINTPSAVTSGVALIESLGSNVWAYSFSGQRTTDSLSFGGGDVTLAQAVTGIRITSENGTDTFDAGLANISWS